MRIDGHDNVVQHSDQRRCLKCGRVWDANDPDPPKCEGDAPWHNARSTTAIAGSDKVKPRRFFRR